MEKKNIYYYALYDEFQKLIFNSRQKLNDAIAENDLKIRHSTELKIYKEIFFRHDKVLNILHDSHYNILDSFYTLPSHIKKLLNELCKSLEEEEVLSLESAINADIINMNYYDKIARLHSEEAKLLQLIYEMSLSDKKIVIRDGYHNKTSLTFEKAVRKMIRLEIESLNIDRGIIKLTSQEKESENKEVQEIDFTSDELNNFEIAKAEANEIINLCDQIKEQLAEVFDYTNIEFPKLQENISNIVLKNQTRINNTNQYLTSLIIGEDIQERYASIGTVQFQREIVEEYKAITKELKRLRKKLPNYQKDLDILERKIADINIEELDTPDLYEEECEILLV